MRSWKLSEARARPIFVWSQGVAVVLLRLNRQFFWHIPNHLAAGAGWQSTAAAGAAGKVPWRCHRMGNYVFDRIQAI